MRPPNCAAVVLAFTMMSCGTTLGEAEGQAAHAGAPAVTHSPTPTPGRPIGSPAPDAIRITDDQGGWSIDAPNNWFHQPAAPYRGGHGFTSYDTATTSIPSKTGVSVNVQLMWDWNGDAKDLRTFAERSVWTATCVACRKVLETQRLTLAGQDAEFYVVEQNQPFPLDELEPRLFWLLRSPYFADRVLVIQAVPRASPLRPAVERMVSTLQLFRPAPPDLRPTKTRQRVVDEFRAGDRTITRVEAKLMRWQDWETAHNAALRAAAGMSGGPTAAHGAIDPDLIVWVVAMNGTFEQLRKGPAPGPGSIGPPGANATPAPAERLMHWRISVVPAREPYSWGGPSFGGPESTWPAWFDQLVDVG